MPRPLKYPESRIVRLPKGTLDRIDSLPGKEAQGEKLRRFVLEMLRKEESKQEFPPG
jgi:hypothetical protein